MRELTKAVGSFSWALSLFAARQGLSLLRQPFPRADHAAARGLRSRGGERRRAAGGWLRGVYDAGDRAQRGFVDLLFGAVEVRGLRRPPPVSAPGSRSRRLRPAGRRGPRPVGWGPMPPLPDLPELHGDGGEDCCG